MNLNQLSVFNAVAETRSVSLGAARLRISQPAVSKQIHALEESLGVALFHRLPRGVQLTEAGRVLAGYARRLGALESEAERALAELKGLRTGRLAVGASTTIGIYLLPEVFGEFRRRYPGIEMDLEIGNTDAIQQRLLEGTADIALTEGMVETDELAAEVFYEDEIVGIAAPNHPVIGSKSITVEAFCAHPLVLREPGSGTRVVVERALAEQGIAVRPVMSLGSTEAIKRAVAAGVGVAFVSRLALGLELDAARLVIVPLSGFTIRRPLHRLLRRGHSPGYAVDAFLPLLGEMLAKR